MANIKKFSSSGIRMICILIVVILAYIVLLKLNYDDQQAIKTISNIYISVLIVFIAIINYKIYKTTPDELELILLKIFMYLGVCASCILTILGINNFNDGITIFTIFVVCSELTGLIRQFFEKKYKKQEEVKNERANKTSINSKLEKCELINCNIENSTVESCIIKSSYINDSNIYSK